MTRTWFITGANRGFGREFTRAALLRGDRVAAASRHPEQFDEFAATYGPALLPLAMDVTDGSSVEASVALAVERFGRLDVIVNNAGYGLFGTIEEISEQQLREQLDVNLFGVLRVTQAVLPILRRQGSGHIIQISSIGGVIAYPMLGAYHASKWALEGLSESLAQEVAGFGIKVTLVEPSGFATDWAGSSARHAEQLPPYEGIRAVMAKRRAATVATPAVGDPKAVGPALLKIVDSEAPPLRVFFGRTPLDVVPQVYAKRLKDWTDWQTLSVEANGH